jgi:hypothetical protein
MGMRIRGAWLRLGEGVRGRWSAYDEARASLSMVGLCTLTPPDP